MPKKLWLLIIGMMINTTGMMFLWPFNTIYLHNMLGHSLSFAGLILMLNAGAGIVGNLFGGVLFDRVGGYRAILVGVCITTSASILLFIFHSTGPYALFMTIMGFGSGTISPAVFAMAGATWPEGGRKPFNALYVAQNIGVAIGSSISGLVASLSFNLIFAVNAGVLICFTFFVFFLFRTIDVTNASGPLRTNTLEGSKKLKQAAPFWALLILCIGFMLCWTGYVQWQSTIASYTQTLGIPISSYGLLWTVNGVLIVLGQPLVNMIIKRMPSTKLQMVIGIIIFIGSFSILSFAHSFVGLVLAMAVLTFGEMFVWPAVPTIANDLAPQGRVGFYQGFVNSAGTGGRMIGPLFGGMMVDLFNMSVLIDVIFVLFIGAMVTTLMYERPMKRVGYSDKGSSVSQE